MAKRHTEQVQHSSKDPNWRTPPALFAALDREVCFVLDVAADDQNKLCGHYFGLDQRDETLRDGLKVDWYDYIYRHYEIDVLDGPLAAFMNPPYSKEAKMPIAPWIRKAYEESLKGLIVYGVIPYSPQTEWWRRWVEGHQTVITPTQPGPIEHVVWTEHAATETRKIPHRVSFLRPDGTEEGNAGGNTAIVVWRPTWGRVGPWVPYSPYWSWK